MKEKKEDYLDNRNVDQVSLNRLVEKIRELEKTNNLPPIRPKREYKEKISLWNDKAKEIIALKQVVERKTFFVDQGMVRNINVYTDCIEIEYFNQFNEVAVGILKRDDTWKEKIEIDKYNIIFSDYSKEDTYFVSNKPAEIVGVVVLE
ncbi:MAG: hypothetical protein ACOZAR_01640 [Patescibacteria group bacterium]